MFVINGFFRVTVIIFIFFVFYIVFCIVLGMLYDLWVVSESDKCKNFK